MFTFIAGVPGTGKSLHLVDRLAHDSMLRNRQVFVDGIPGLDQDAIPHTRLPFEGTLYEFELELDGTKKIDDKTGSYVRIGSKMGLCTSLNWPQWVNPGDLVVVDECQRHWRNRASGTRVPESVTELETHRSRYSVDLIYASQKPSLVDANVKAQVGKFFYIRKGWFGRFMYEADELFNFESRTERGLQKKKRYWLPKRSYSLYVSAQVHNKTRSSPPLAVFLLPLVLLGAAYAAYSVFLSMDKRAHPEKYKQSAAREELATTGKQPIDSVVTGQIKRSVTLDDYKPAIPGRPETAPAFDEIRRVSAMPLISACVQSADRCTCYSQQGSRLNEISPERCAEILKGGKLFNPYLTNYSSPQDVVATRKTI